MDSVTNFAFAFDSYLDDHIAVLRRRAQGRWLCLTLDIVTSRLVMAWLRISMLIARRDTAIVSHHPAPLPCCIDEKPWTLNRVDDRRSIIWGSF